MGVDCRSLDRARDIAHRAETSRASLVAAGTVDQGVDGLAARSADCCTSSGRRGVRRLAGEGERQYTDRVNIAQTDDAQFDEEDVDYSDYAEVAFDRVSRSLGTLSSEQGEGAECERLLAEVLGHTEQLLGRREWRCRYTPLVTLAAIAEGCAGVRGLAECH